MSDQEAVRRMALAAIAETRDSAERLIETAFDDLWHGFELIRDTFQQGRHVHVCGNGGSAADAQHFVTELVVRLDSNSKRRPLPATALSTDTSILTAAANDLGFVQVFARQIEARAQAGDLLLLISTSGKSANLLIAAHAARLHGVFTLALLGRDGGELRSIVDCAVIVPSQSTQRIQEVHSLCLHLWCEWLEPCFPSSH
ncbi:MAG: SIS domain-containing protein [Candidatus Zixiibacteriota bacterium]